MTPSSWSCQLNKSENITIQELKFHKLEQDQKSQKNQLLSISFIHENIFQIRVI